MAYSGCHDPDPYEYLSSDLFWLLGIAIAVNGWWTNRQVEFVSKPKTKSDALQIESGEPDTEAQVAHDTSSETQAIHDMSNETPPSSESDNANTPSDGDKSLILEPYITSKFRKFLALLTCSLVLPLQVLEGSWVLTTTWRLTVALLKATYPRFRPRLLGFILYLPISAIILFAWATVIATGAFLICSQILYLYKLKELEPGAYSRLSTEDKSENSKSSDGEWDQVEEVAQGGDKDENAKAD
ncbi:hypothetical protein AK830_g118 [Neonectria ditissima]|uniref:Uncharacterized protein n=1 Tax=Neonectria ditissima TaxID=78410 RepID=A0A0P7BZD7_9HYPO|nr:hypothetical protein AK830_g118 [Neonectria ditissima]